MIMIIIIIIMWHAHYVSIAVSTILRHQGRSCAWRYAKHRPKIQMPEVIIEKSPWSQEFEAENLLTLKSPTKGRKNLPLRYFRLLKSAGVKKGQGVLKNWGMLTR